MGSEWQPIETAPKDGTAILLCWGRDADGKLINWASDWKTAGVFLQVASWGWDEGWIVYINTPSDAKLHFEPTHWMPLPEPPGMTDTLTEAELDKMMLSQKDAFRLIAALQAFVDRMERG